MAFVAQNTETSSFLQLAQLLFNLVQFTRYACHSLQHCLPPKCLPHLNLASDYVSQGVLPDGREIAVKRLFLTTRQWTDQFFNEVKLVSQVQHKNLVKLLGCSVEGPESLLVYEYLCNTSLDHYLFEP